MTFEKIHEHFTAVGYCGEMIAMGLDWMTVKTAAHKYAVETGLDVTIAKVTVIKVPTCPLT